MLKYELLQYLSIILLKTTSYRHYVIILFDSNINVKCQWKFQLSALRKI